MQIGRTLSRFGEGGSFSDCCLTALRTVKIPGIATFQESLIAFEQIPAIPAKFREIFIEKPANLGYTQQNFAKSGMIAEFYQNFAKFKSRKF